MFIIFTPHTRSKALFCGTQKPTSHGQPRAKPTTKASTSNAATTAQTSRLSARSKHKARQAAILSQMPNLSMASTTTASNKWILMGQKRCQRSYLSPQRAKARQKSRFSHRILRGLFRQKAARWRLRISKFSTTSDSWFCQLGQRAAWICRQCLRVCISCK